MSTRTLTQGGFDEFERTLQGSKTSNRVLSLGSGNQMPVGRLIVVISSMYDYTEYYFDNLVQ